MDTVSVLRLVAKSWDYLQLLEKKSMYIAELASQLGKEEAEVSVMITALASAELVTKQRSRRVDCALTDQGRRWVKAVHEAETRRTPGEMPSVNSDELKFLLSEVRSSASPESIEEAEDLLVKTVTTGRISHSDAEALVSAARKHLAHNEPQRWSRWLSIVHALEKNSEDKTVRLLIQQNIMPLVMDLLERSELQGPSRTDAGNIARDLMGKENWHTSLRKLVDTKMKQTPAVGDAKWSMTEDSLIDSLREMYATDRLDVLRWLFGLMQSKEEEHVKRRAQQLIQRLKG